MTTWNTITIENPGALTLDTLPDALTGDAEIWESRDERDWRVTVPARKASYGTYVYPEQIGDPEGSIVIAGGSKWRPDEAIEALIELSKTTGRITHEQSWDDDNGGQEVAVYENGAEVEAEKRVSELVPANLAELVAAARTALNNSDTAATQEQQDALRALVDALDPQKAVTA